MAWKRLKSARAITTGEVINEFPASLQVLNECVPIYESFPGWDEDITGIRELADLPAQAGLFLDRVSEICGAPIALIGVGSRRSQTIVTKEDLY